MANDLATTNKPNSAALTEAQLEALTGSTPLSSGVSTPCDSVSASTYGAVSWKVCAKKTDGTRYEAVIDAKLVAGGASVDYSEAGIDDAGGLNVAFSADLSGGSIRLLALASEAGWTAYWWRLPTLFP